MRARTRIAALVVIAIGGVVALSTLLRGGRHDLDLFMFGWALFVYFSLLLIPLHELGHVVAARIVNAPAYAVVLGDEPWIIDRDWSGVRWRVGKTFGGGLTYHAPCEGPHERRRTLVILGGGLAVNALAALAAAGIAVLFERAREPFILVLSCYVLAGASAIQFLSNAWPREVRSSVGKIKNDGARILALLRGEPLETKTARALMHSMRALFAFRDRNFSRAAGEAGLAAQLWVMPKARDARDNMVVLRAAACAESDDAAGAVALLRPLLDVDGMHAGVRSGVEDNLAWAYLLLDERELLEQALPLLARAREVAPWQTSYLISDACVLAASSDADNQRVVRARALLTGIQKEKLDRQSAAYAALARGLCAAAEGDFATAIRQRDTAKQLGATAAPLRVLERRIPSH